MHFGSLVATTSYWFLLAAGHAPHDDQPKIPVCSTTVESLPAQLLPGLASKRVKYRYGPFQAPSVLEDYGMRDFNCMPPPPCKDCAVLYMHAGLEYADGSIAETATGMMLHHVVFVNLQQQDLMCKGRSNQRFFASGNERTPVDMTSGGAHRYGYMVKPEDVFALELELMNMEKVAATVFLTVIWEYVDENSQSFKPIQPYWFDIGGCKSSSKPAKEDAVFEYASPTVQAPSSGTISMIGAHLHDGGTYVELMREDEPYCSLQASYDAHGLSKMSSCRDLPYEKGDHFSIVAHYNTSQHKPMKHADGELEPVMGIALLYAVEAETGDSRNYTKILMVAMSCFAIGLALSFGYAWYRVQRQKQKNILPVWLRQLRTQRLGRYDEPLLDNQNDDDDQTTWS